MNEKAKAFVIMTFTPISLLYYLSIKSNFSNYSIINTLAPAEDQMDEEKNEFYDDFEIAYEGCPRMD